MTSPHLEPPGFGFAGVAAGGVDLCGAAAGEDPTSAWEPMMAIRGGGRGRQWKDVAGVLEQDDALFGDVLGVVASAEGIDDRADRGIVDDAGGEHAAQDAVDHVIEPGGGT